MMMVVVVMIMMGLVMVMRGLMMLPPPLTGAGRLVADADAVPDDDRT